MSLISISNDAIIYADISTFPLRIVMIIFAMVLFRTSITYPTKDNTSFSDPTAAVLSLLTATLCTQDSASFPVQILNFVINKLIYSTNSCRSKPISRP